ncbi:unnamed protein product [Prunus armeniaca]
MENSRQVISPEGYAHQPISNCQLPYAIQCYPRTPNIGPNEGIYFYSYVDTEVPNPPWHRQCAM